jgi:pilus assembly protein FimV
MVRKPVVIFTSFVLLAAANAKALGLGDITLESALNQPLRANIPVLQLGGVRAEQISVQLASASDFERFSIDREAFLDNIRFDVRSAGAEAIVQISTRDAVREPYLSFVLETRWPSGRLLNEYTVLLDLPAFAQDAPAPVIQQPSQQTAPDFSSSQTFINQSIAGSYSSDSQAQPVRLAAPAPASPTTIEEPPAALVAQLDANAGADAAAPVNAAAAPAPQTPAAPAATPGPLAAPADAETLTTDANDTLWDIALRVRPDSSVSVQQTMLAIQRLNTDAFIGDNINMIRRGQVLRLPDIEQIRALSSREAIGEVARQNQLFENRRNVPLTAQPLTPPPSAPATPDASPRGELSVVSVDNAEPGTQTASGQSAELDARIASLEDVLAVQREEADRAALLNTELTERLGLLEEQIASAQEIIRLRDLELAQLQESLANAPAEEPVVEEPPTVITMAPERSFLETLLASLVANTAALLAVTALIISLLVFMLIKRNRAAEQAAALAGMDGLAAEPRISEDLPVAAVPEVLERSALAAEDGKASESQDPVFVEIFDLAASADDELKQAAPGVAGAGLALGSVEEAVEEATTDGADALELDMPSSSGDILLEEVSALLSESRYPEAIALLQDSIVVQPARTDLRLKLLEAFAGAQDPVGFKLQETELRDLAGDSLAPQIAALRAGLREAVADELLEEGEAGAIDDIAAVDDLELALDMEASAEVDDARVLAGFNVDDASAADEFTDAPVATPAAEADEFALDDLDFDFDVADEDDPVAEPAAAASQSVTLDDNFDLAAEDDANVVEFDSVTGTEEAAELAREPASQEEDDNLLDLDFDLSIDEDEPLKAQEPETEEPLPDTESSEHEVDFDFAVLDDEPEPARSSAVEAAVEDEEDLDFDAAVFELADEEEVAPQPAEATTAPGSAAKADDFDDLQFVDETLLDALEKPEADKSAVDDDDEVFEYLSDADEAATKLDLARAYFEMGDSDGAREILEEVLREGNEDQVKDARTLLSKL